MVHPYGIDLNYFKAKCTKLETREASKYESKFFKYTIPNNSTIAAYTTCHGLFTVVHCVY